MFKLILENTKAKGRQMSILNCNIFSVSCIPCASFLELEGTYWNVLFGPLFSLTTPSPNLYHQLMKLFAENRFFVCYNLMVRWFQISKNQSEKSLNHPEAVWLWLSVLPSTYRINIVNRKYVSRNHYHIAYSSKIENISGDLVLA